MTGPPATPPAAVPSACPDGAGEPGVATSSLMEDVWRICEGTTTVTGGPQRHSSKPVMSRANEADQDRLDSRSLDGMQEVRGSQARRISRFPARLAIPQALVAGAMSCDCLVTWSPSEGSW